MKSRWLFGAVLVLVAALGGCGDVAVQPTPLAENTPLAGGTASTVGETVTMTPLNPVAVETNDATRTGTFTEERTLNMPPGFGIEVFATGLQHVRMLALSPEGELFATVRAEGRVVRLPDKDNDGVADEVKTFADGMDGVHGLAFRQGAVYAATETSIFRLQDTDGDGAADKREVLVDDLPTGGVGRAGQNHSTRTIIFGPDDKMYVSIGSSCNACIEEDERRAAILRYTPDGKLEKIYARGVRNAVGIGFHPETGEFWAVNNGRDGLGEDLPPEAVYKLREDGNYGWPYCYGDRVTDATQDVPPGYCDKVDVAEFYLFPHAAPLGFAFYTGNQFPEEYRGDMFVTSHGSWDRKVRRGYSLMRVHFKDGQPDRSTGGVVVEDFITGWLTDPIEGTHWGRPVAPLVAPDGSLFLSDDASMSIYNIYYMENAGP